MKVKGVLVALAPLNSIASLLVVVSFNAKEEPPSTSSFASGEETPIPTSPVAVTLTLSVLSVRSLKYPGLY